MGGMSMNHKILFVDLDATLLSDDKTVSEENRAAIQKMLLAGHDIVLSTGRPVESGRAVARELELTQPGCYMIAFNGAVLYDCAADRVLLKRSLPIEVTQELFERASKAGIYAQTYNNTEIITTRHTAELEYYRKKTGLSYKLSANVLDLLESGLVDYIISTSPHGRDPHRDSVKFRRKATELSIPTITAMDTARVLVDALRGDHDISQMELVDIANLHREAAKGE